jgi:hypothetical protein
VKPGEGRCFGDMLTDHRDYAVRGEMTSTPDCSSLPGNSHVLCDTGDVGFPNFNGGFNVRYAKFNQNATSCSWATKVTSTRR